MVYRIYYIEDGMKSSDYITVNATSVKKLAKQLNTMKKRWPKRRILQCCVFDSSNKYVDFVRFLDFEYQRQEWLTGYKERLLAYGLVKHKLNLSVGLSVEVI